jgi:hypothetical protein
MLTMLCLLLDPELESVQEVLVGWVLENDVFVFFYGVGRKKRVIYGIWEWDHGGLTDETGWRMGLMGFPLT